MKLIYILALIACLLSQGCFVIINKSVILENHSINDISISSSNGEFEKTVLNPSKKIQLLSMRNDTLLMENNDGLFWEFKERQFFSPALNQETEDAKPQPLFVNNTRPHPFSFHTRKVFVIMRIVEDKLYLIPIDKKLHGVYKRLQPEGFPIIGINTSLYDKTIFNEKRN